jgi:hypothetical protein
MSIDSENIEHDGDADPDIKDIANVKSQVGKKSVLDGLYRNQGGTSKNLYIRHSLFDSAQLALN